jgi:hypothetical protein
MPDDIERKPIISERTAGRMLDVYVGAKVEYIFADGTARLAFGPQVSKVEFYRVTSIKEENHGGAKVPVEQRDIFCQLTLPSASLVEFCGLVLENLGANVHILDAAHEQLKNTLRAAVQKAATVRI